MASPKPPNRVSAILRFCEDEDEGEDEDEDEGEDGGEPALWRTEEQRNGNGGTGTEEQRNRGTG
ncbi:hypothetical protein PC9H_007958 [Pleurotus ostreatus]|uniref:Uncharacterized protein n=1 Tax=Pleurotus ostreatus TaxID=5322 RepID=A0A8H6ZV49_PLEOS|nr:uncharacterized protein PC9H_007958 [Pleurotus ostreatus]KAF7428729.1 hypothetical protein PC9H_007958 [Pleurotus ostreatus]